MISIVSCKGLFEDMFNYYQHRASPDDEASDIGYEDFVHLVGLSWLGVTG
jgi:hypothetical protein